jgi:hypothetical protein
LCTNGHGPQRGFGTTHRKGFKLVKLDYASAVAVEEIEERNTL